MTIIYIIFTLVVIFRPGCARAAVTNILDFAVWFTLMVLERVGDLGRSQQARRVVHHMSHTAGQWIWAGMNKAYAGLMLLRDLVYWLIGLPLHLCKGTPEQRLPAGSTTANIEGDSRTTPGSTEAAQTCAGYKESGRCTRKTPRAYVGTDWYCWQHKLQAAAVAEGVVFTRLANRHEAG